MTAYVTVLTVSTMKSDPRTTTHYHDCTIRDVATTPSYRTLLLSSICVNTMNSVVFEPLSASIETETLGIDNQTSHDARSRFPIPHHHPLFFFRFAPKYKVTNDDVH